MKPEFNLIIVGVIIIFAVLYAAFQISSAVECGKKGGAYVIPHGSFPVCVKEIK